MAMQVGKKFSWVIKDFPSLQCKICHSAPVLIGDCKWFLHAYPKGNKVDYLSLYLEVADSESLPSGWRKYVKFRLSIVKQNLKSDTELQETHCWFDEEARCWGFQSMIPLTKLHDEKEGFLVDGDLVIVAEVDVLEVIGNLDESEESEESCRPVKKSKHGGGEESIDSLKEAHLGKETMDVNGFHVLVSQGESVKRIFEMHPDIAVEFRAKNQHLRNACMSFLLSLTETLCVSLQELSNEDLVEADVALTYVRDAGFKVNWLEKKLETVKEKKEKEKCSLIRLEEMKDSLLKLKQKCSDLEALVEKEEAELSAIRTPSSFDDVQSVRLIFERHPETAVEFRAKNQHLRTRYINFLLSLIETLYQPLQELSSEDLVEADIALTYLKDVGFKVDWLENNLDLLKARKEKERACEARVQEMEVQLHDLKHKFEIEKAELSAARAPLSFDDFV
uniref:MATH domain-containing protein n=1 Tax=Brassica campestris TaxID=3711 RepID=M4DDK4_BRACM